MNPPTEAKFAERAHHHVHARQDTQRGRSSSPVGAEHAQRMGLVHIDPAAVPVGKLGDGGQVGDGAFHAEHRVHDDDPAAPSVRRSTRARWSMSLCRYKVKSAPDNLAASNRLRWFSASWMIMSPDSHSALIAARLL